MSLTYIPKTGNETNESSPASVSGKYVDLLFLVQRSISWLLGMAFALRLLKAKDLELASMTVEEKLAAGIFGW